MPDKLMIYSIKFGNLIIKNESKEIEWYEILKAFGFEHLLKNNERLIQSYYFGDEDYKSNVIQLIYDALNENENEALKFIEYLLKNYTTVSEEDINDFPKDFNYLDSNKEKFNKCFISYAYENRNIGHQIKRKLEKFSISCFLAHEDIECSKEWQKKILEELKGADLFIPILSEEFNKSHFCSQEVGIAVFRNLLIVPVSLDGTIPEGFLKKIQSKKLNQSNKNIINILLESSPKIMINHGIDALESEFGYSNCHELLRYLERYFDVFDEKQINKLINVSIKNDQIYNSVLCKPYLENFFVKHEKRIEPDLIKAFKEKFNA